MDEINWWLVGILAALALFAGWLVADYRRWSKKVEEVEARAKAERAKRVAREE